MTDSEVIQILEKAFIGTATKAEVLSVFNVGKNAPKYNQAVFTYLFYVGPNGLVRARYSKAFFLRDYIHGAVSYSLIAHNQQQLDSCLNIIATELSMATL